MIISKENAKQPNDRQQTPTEPILNQKPHGTYIPSTKILSLQFKKRTQLIIEVVVIIE